MTHKLSDQSKMGCNNGISVLLHDGYRYVLQFRDTLKRGALFIYYFVLPFSPRDSSLYKTYYAAVCNPICLLYGMQEQWSPLLTEIDFTEESE